MTVTTIYRIFFPWYEYQAMLKFEAENMLYKKVAEDTAGTTFEYVTYSVVDMEDRKEE